MRSKFLGVTVGAALMYVLMAGTAAAQGASIVFYWQCLIDVPMPEMLKSRHSILVDGRKAAEIGACEIRKVGVSAGQHAVRFVAPMSLDFAGAFGLEGEKHNVAAGQTVYVRLRYFQYVETQVVPASVAKSNMAQMSR